MFWYIGVIFFAQYKINCEAGKDNNLKDEEYFYLLKKKIVKF